MGSGASRGRYAEGVNGHGAAPKTVEVAPVKEVVEEPRSPAAYLWPLDVPEDEPPTLLSADIGGTSSRFAIFMPPPMKEEMQDRDLLVPADRMIFQAKYRNDKYDSFTEIMSTFLKDSGLKKPPLMACLAVAGVVVDNAVRFVNLGWQVRGAELEGVFGIRQVQLINDFVAQGYGVLTLDGEECDKLTDAEPLDGAPKAVLGAGTGLGEAFMTVGNNGDYEVWPSEGGHAEFAPRNDGSSKLQFEMLQYLQIKFSAKARISVERIVSGKGIANIYEFLAWKYPERVNRAVHQRFLGRGEGATGQTFDPAVVVQAACDGTCGLCADAVDIFVGAYGSEAGVMGLRYMPFAGVYLTGGVTQRTRDFIMGTKGAAHHFLDAFLDKGRVAKMLERIPVYIAKGEDLGERGAQLKAGRLFLESGHIRQVSGGHM